MRWWPEGYHLVQLLVTTLPPMVGDTDLAWLPVVFEMSDLAIVFGFIGFGAGTILGVGAMALLGGADMPPGATGVECKGMVAPGVPGVLRRSAVSVPVNMACLRVFLAARKRASFLCSSVSWPVFTSDRLMVS